MLNDFGRFLV